jgi:hypothetical protein
VIKRRPFVVGCLALFTARMPIAAEAQQADKVWRIGFLEAGSSSVNRHFLDAFRQGLNELGYQEGQQIAIEDRWAEGRNDRFPGLVAELIRLKVAVIVAASTPATLAAKNATKEIPIVMTLVSDPVGAGFVASLSRPGGNITGLASIANEVVGKQLELLKVAARRVSHPVTRVYPQVVPAITAAALKNSTVSLGYATNANRAPPTATSTSPQKPRTTRALVCRGSRAAATMTPAITKMSSMRGSITIAVARGARCGASCSSRSLANSARSWSLPDWPMADFPGKAPHELTRRRGVGQVDPPAGGAILNPG